jgi:hypothetical protein
MTCEACRAAAAHDVDGEIAARLHAASSTICGCEKFRLSDLSPRRVEDTEMLDLIISDPQSIQGGKLPHPSALVQIDRGGLSVLRDTASNDEFEITIRELKDRAEASGRERFFHGICSIPTTEIRVDGARRFLCVYDTALPAKPNHADIFGPDLKAMAETGISNAEHERRKRARIKRFIDKIGDCFVPASAFRQGAFIAHTRPKEN